MAKKKKDNPLDYINIPSLDMNPEVKKNVWALFILTLAIVSALGLFDQGGIIGTYLRQGLTWLFGWGRWLLPLAFFVWSIFIFFKERLEIKFLHYLGLILLCLSIVSLMQLSIPHLDWPAALLLGKGGGNLGYWMATGLVMAVGMIASFVISFFVGLVSLMFIFNATLSHIFDKSCAPFRVAMIPFKKLFSFAGNKDQSDSDETEDEAPQEEDNEDEETDEEENNDEEEEEEGDEEEEEDEEENNDEEEDEEVKFEQKVLPTAKPIIDEAVNIWYPTRVSINLPIELLENRMGKPRSGDVKECGRLIQSTLANFGIQVEMDEYSIGPTVTQYSLRPADGIKLSKITNLQNNLSMALAAHPLRIEAPIPGKPLVGIEVPNKTIATVGLREIITSEQFKSKGNKLTFALGKDVANKPWVTTIDSMPHLMVAGQTGSGKSVMINSIIISLLYHNNPDDLRMIMIDPKRVELTQYDDIPHLLTPVITDASKTVNALKWTINEMDRRLRLLQKFKKKDIASFNQTAKQRLPYIVFIIDELADLMMLSGKEVEPGIVRIAQMARAVGIHLILATQRPSVNVITGLIKANMPSRIAFAVQSQIDSRTILDGPGAEKLLGRGDMLFANSSMSKPKRIQGAFVSEKEIQKIVAEIKRQAGKPQYLDGVTEKQKVSGNFSLGMSAGSSEDDEDDKLEAAREVIVNSGKASATMLQRHLGIGYARAAKLLDILEEQGVIGPSQGSKPRSVLITPEQLQSGLTMSGLPLHKQSESRAPEEYLDEVDEEENDEDEEDEENDNEDSEEENDDEDNQDEDDEADSESDDEEDRDEDDETNEEDEEEDVNQDEDDEADSESDDEDDRDEDDETNEEDEEEDVNQDNDDEEADNEEELNDDEDEEKNNDPVSAKIPRSKQVVKDKKRPSAQKPVARRINSFVTMDNEINDDESVSAKRASTNTSDDFDRYFAR